MFRHSKHTQSISLIVDTDSDESESMALLERKTDFISERNHSILELAANDPAKAIALLKSRKMFMNQEEYNYLEKVVIQQLKLHYPFSSAMLSQYISPQIAFLQILDAETVKILPNELWCLVSDYLQNFALLRNCEGSFFKDPVILNDQHFAPVVVEREELNMVLDEKIFIDAGINQDNIDSKLIPVPLIRHLIQRKRLSIDWYLLPSSLPNVDEKEIFPLNLPIEQKRKLELQTNTHEIYTDLASEHQTILSLELKNLIVEAKQNNLPYINLHRVLHKDLVIWQQQLAKDPLTLADIRAMPLHDKMKVMQKRSLILQLVYAEIPFIFLVATQIQNPVLASLTAILSIPDLVMHYMIYLELLESPVVRGQWNKWNYIAALTLVMLSTFFAALNIPSTMSLFDHLTGYILMEVELGILSTSLSIIKALEGYIDTAFVMILLLQTKQYPSYKDYFKSLKPALIYAYPAFALEVMLYFPNQLRSLEHNAPEIPTPHLVILSLFKSATRLLPALTACSQSAQEAKNIISASNQLSPINFDETRTSSMIKNSIAIMSVLFCGLRAYQESHHWENESSGYFRIIFMALAALAMLNECSLPRAIRAATLPSLANLPQILLPARQRNEAPTIVIEKGSREGSRHI